jgi:hypothetical protein
MLKLKRKLKLYDKSDEPPVETMIEMTEFVPAEEVPEEEEVETEEVIFEYAL